MEMMIVIAATDSEDELRYRKIIADKDMKCKDEPIQFYIPKQIKDLLDMKIDGMKNIGNADIQLHTGFKNRSAFLRDVITRLVLYILIKKGQIDLLPEYYKKKILRKIENRKLERNEKYHLQEDDDFMKRSFPHLLDF